MGGRGSDGEGPFLSIGKQLLVHCMTDYGEYGKGTGFLWGRRVSCQVRALSYVCDCDTENNLRSLDCSLSTWGFFFCFCFFGFFLETRPLTGLELAK